MFRTSPRCSARHRPALALLTLLAVVACGGAPRSAATTSTAPRPPSHDRPPTPFTFPPTTTTTTPPTTQPPVTTPRPPAVPIPSVSWPPFQPLPGVTGSAALTGLAIDDATAARPIIAVKVDNASQARGQWGLDGADVIFEENVESITRFIALFQSRQPGEVGPVRSARTGDLYILSGMNRPILAWSGGNAVVTAWVRGAAEAGRLVDLSALRVGCYRRESSRPKPHNLVLSLECARNNSGGAGPARPLWDFAPAGSTPTGAPTTAFDVRMDGVRPHWEWDAAQGYYVRWTNGAVHTTAGGVPITATNVVVVSCSHIPSPADGRSSVPVTVGSGSVVVHSGGVARSGSWVRETDTSPWQFVADDGSPILLTPGTTFVELTRG